MTSFSSAVMKGILFLSLITVVACNETKTSNGGGGYRPGNGSGSGVQNSPNQAEANLRAWTNRVIVKLDETSRLYKRLESDALALERNPSLPSFRAVRVTIMDLDRALADLQNEFNKTDVYILGRDRARVGEVIEMLAQHRSQNLELLRIVNEAIEQLEQPKVVVAPSVPAGSPIVASDAGGTITGRVNDAVRGTPVVGANVGFRERDSRDYFHRTTTDSTGSYRSPYLRPGDYQVDVWYNGYSVSRRSQVGVTRGRAAEENVSLTQPVAEGVYRITMSWTGMRAGAVSDVDSYLAIPGVADPLGFPKQRTNYYGADLDRDDTDWEGPETITIREVKNGTYTYYVNNFNFRQQRDALGNSLVRVQVYKGNQMIREYRVPAGTGNTYEVFKIVNGQLYDVQQYNDSLRVY